MKFISVKDFARKWNLSERTVRDYCADGKIKGAFLTGKTWNIPEETIVPDRKNKKQSSDNPLLNRLKEEKDLKLKGGIYHRTQIDLTYNSNRIEGSKLTHDQTRFIFETNTLGVTTESINIDDIIETNNHFRCIDLTIEKAKSKLSEAFIKEIHQVLKSSTSDSRKEWFRVGDYKKLPNEVGGLDTCPPLLVHSQMKELLTHYHSIKTKTFEDIIEFHLKFERIHPFQDGNGRVGRLIMFKECLAHNLTPFIIDENLKWFYYRGLSEWDQAHGYLIDTCLAAQDKYKVLLDYFHIGY